MMEPKILDRESFQTLGTASRVERGTETPEMFRKIWEQFESFREEIEAYSTDRKYYGVSFPTAEKGVIQYLAGMAVEDVEAVPEGLEIRTIPAGQYAVWACSLQAIGQTYQYVFGKWLPESKYRLSTIVPSFEQYPPREVGAGSVELYIPVEPK